MASTASMFEKVSLAESQQHLEAKAGQSPTRKNLSSSSFPAQRSSARSKSPDSPKSSNTSVAGDNDDVFYHMSPCDTRDTPPVDSAATTHSNNSYPAVCQEQEHSLGDEKDPAKCGYVPEQMSLEKQDDSTGVGVSSETDPLWSAQRKRYQLGKFVSNQPAHDASALPASRSVSKPSHSADQSPVNASMSVTSPSECSASRRRHQSYEGAVDLDLSSDKSRSTCADARRTLQKSYTMDTGMLAMQAPRVTVHITSKKVDNGQLETLTKYRQKPVVVQVSGDSQFE